LVGKEKTEQNMVEIEFSKQFSEENLPEDCGTVLDPVIRRGDKLGAGF
jgi:hypothetical protein